MRADSLAKKLEIRLVKEFWKDMKTMTSVKTSLPANIDGVSGLRKLLECGRNITVIYLTLFSI